MAKCFTENWAAEWAGSIFQVSIWANAEATNKNRAGQSRIFRGMDFLPSGQGMVF
jgi:hypothetical protein